MRRLFPREQPLFYDVSSVRDVEDAVPYKGEYLYAAGASSCPAGKGKGYFNAQVYVFCQICAVDIDGDWNVIYTVGKNSDKE